MTKRLMLAAAIVALALGGRASAQTEPLPLRLLSPDKRLEITLGLGDDGAPVYRVSSQVGSESVVQPEDPTSVAELLTFRREGQPPQVAQVKIEVPSNRLPSGSAQLWPDAKLAELGALLFRVHDHFATNVYPQIVPLHLDFEVKHSAEGDVVIKQVRPFSGIGDKAPP